MLAADRDALVCDLAEAYGLFDLGAVPAGVLATLACGLREGSRSKSGLSGSRFTMSELLLAGAVDRLSLLLNVITGKDSGKLLLPILLGGQETANGSVQGFDTAEDFEAAWARRTGVAHGR